MSNEDSPTDGDNPADKFLESLFGVNGGNPPGLSPMLLAAVQLHEFYRAYIEAGFTPSESMEIVKTMITAMLGNDRD